MIGSETARTGHGVADAPPRDPRLKRAPAPVSSPFQRVAVGAGCRSATPAEWRRLLNAELDASPRVEGQFVFLSLPNIELPTTSMMAVCAELAAEGGHVVIMAREIDRVVSVDGRTPHSVPLRPDDLLIDEWLFVRSGPMGGVALAALEPMGSARQPDRTLRFGRSESDDVVMAVLDAVLHRIPHLAERVDPRSSVR